MRTPSKFCLACLAALVALFTLAFLTGCESMTPEERAVLVRAADRAITIGLDKLETTHPQK